MGGTTLYRTLFQVRILHHYFLNKGAEMFDNIAEEKDKTEIFRNYDIQEFLTIEPTESCKKLLKQYRCVFKVTRDGFLVGIRSRKISTDKFKALFKPAGNLHFSFLISFIDNFFINYTCLPLKRNLKELDGFISQDKNVYYCHNLTTGAAKKPPFITKIAPKFKNGTAYSAGDILSDNETNPTQLFIAKKIATTAPPSENWIDDDIVSGKPLQYAGINDLLPVFTDMLRFNSGLPDADLVVTVTDVQGNNIPVETKFIKDKTGNVPEKLIALTDIHLLNEGFYKINFKEGGFDKTFSFYRLAKPTEVDMIVDLFIKSNTASYTIIDVDNDDTNDDDDSDNDLMKSPVFEIRFRNRATTWQYKGNKFSDNSVSGPNPLTKNGYINATVKDKNDQDVDDLPNPSVKMIKAKKADDNTNTYDTISEIFIH